MLKRLVLITIRGYRSWVSPYLPPRCRFYPSCSEYALACFTRFGLAKATGRTLVRLSRCHPFSRGGVDYP